jgi:hypothetical protein
MVFPLRLYHHGGPMGPLRHGSARTTAAVRRAIQPRQASIAALADRHALHPTTVATWRRYLWCAASLPSDRWTLVSRPGRRHSRTSRGRPYRGWQGPGIRRLPAVAGDAPKQNQCRRDPIGSFPIDIAEVRTEGGKLCLCMAIDRPSKCADAARHPRATKAVTGPRGDRRPTRGERGACP